MEDRSSKKMLPLEMTMSTNEPRVIDYEDEYVTIKGTISLKEINPSDEPVDPSEESSFKHKVIIIRSKSSSPGIQVTVDDEDKLSSELDDIIEGREVIWVDDYESETLPSSNEGETVVKQEPTEESHTGSKVRVKIEGEDSSKDSKVRVKIEGEDSAKDSKASSASSKYRVEDDPEYERLCEIDPNITEFLEDINELKNFNICPSILAPLGYYVYVKKDTWGDVLRAALKEQLESFFVFKEHEASYTENLLANHSFSEKVIVFKWKNKHVDSVLWRKISVSLKYLRFSTDSLWQGDFSYYTDLVTKVLVSHNQEAILDYLKENNSVLSKLGYSSLDSIMDLFPDFREESQRSQKRSRSVTPIEGSIKSEDATYSDGSSSSSSESPEPRRVTPRKRTRSGRTAALGHT